MLKLKYLFENYSLAKECLSFYNYDQESVDDMIRRFRISSNAIYPFRGMQFFDQICFLRLSPIEEKPISEVVSEVKMINWLIDNGCNVMKPYPMKNGKFVDIADTIWGKFNVSCFERVPGTDLEHIHGTIDIVRGYGECLGKLHQTIKHYPLQKERRDHKALLKEIRGRLQSLGASKLILSELSDVEKELSKLNIDDNNYGIVHYDFEPDNVFFDEKNGTYNIIDFDDAIRCWFSLDILRAIDCLDDVVGNDELSDAKAAFLEGYRKMCVFTKEQADTMPLMKRLVRIQEYSTILYVLSEPVDSEPEWLIGLKHKLSAKLNALEKSMQYNFSI